MRPNNVLHTDQAYKRGIILGLTMAEIFLLLLFSLLLVLAARSIDQTKQITESARTIAEQLKNTVSRNDMDSITKELVRLEELDQLQARLVELLKIDENATAPELKGQLIEKISKLNDVAEIIENAGFPLEPKELESDLDGVKELVEADEALKNATSEIKKNAEELENFNQAIIQKDGQIANMKNIIDSHGKGTEKPACYADKTGKPLYIYDAELTSEGIIVWHSETPSWAKARQLPINDIPYGKNLGPHEFLREAKPIFQWSEDNGCIFFVRAYDLTGPTEKKLYKRHTRFLGQRFYKYEVVDGQRK
jgi:hypothetical protein